MWVQNSPLTQNKEDEAQNKEKTNQTLLQLNKLQSKKKRIFPNLGLGNFLKLKRRRVGEDEEELTYGFSLILEQEIKLEVETRAC